MVLVPTISKKFPPGIRFLFAQGEWTERCLAAIDQCAIEHNACHGCQVSKECRKTYDSLIDQRELNTWVRQKNERKHQS